MQVTLYFFGKQNEIEPRELELIRRIGFRCPISLIALPQAGLKDSIQNKKKEADSFFKKIQDSDFLIAFDEAGTEYDSLQFADSIQKSIETHRHISFVIGGAYGLDTTILDRAQKKLRFGRMVWTRKLFRLMALEQLYRSFEINTGTAFHKD